MLETLENVDVGLIFYGRVLIHQIRLIKIKGFVIMFNKKKHPPLLDTDNGNNNGDNSTTGQQPFNVLEKRLYLGVFVIVGVCILLLSIYIVLCIISIKCYNPDLIISSISSVMKIVHDYWRASLLIVLLMFYRPLYKALMELEKWYTQKHIPTQTGMEIVKTKNPPKPQN